MTKINVIDMKATQEHGFEFCPTVDGAEQCCNIISPEFLATIVTMNDFVSNTRQVSGQRRREDS